MNVVYADVVDGHQLGDGCGGVVAVGAAALRSRHRGGAHEQLRRERNVPDPDATRNQIIAALQQAREQLVSLAEQL